MAGTKVKHLLPCCSRLEYTREKPCRAILVEEDSAKVLTVRIVLVLVILVAVHVLSLELTKFYISHLCSCILCRVNRSVLFYSSTAHNGEPRGGYINYSKAKQSRYQTRSVLT